MVWLGHNWSGDYEGRLCRIRRTYAGRSSPVRRRICTHGVTAKTEFRWLGHDALIDDGIVEAIVGKVYVDPENIYPCVDIG